ncbi:Lsr2 family protein [Corynebacterium simulans]|nr:MULTISPECIES: histone-like nucleoid-structuring protein Lsr2 [Corynebacterium]MDK7139323.1 Lsr2 family protein [Corynebacterium simulans]
MRAWARKRGIPVAHRGKIPHEIVDAYNAAGAQ